MSDRLNDVSPSERVAIVTLELARGRELEPGQVADMTDCDLSTAYRVLERISRVIPLCEDGGRWSLLSGSIDLNIG
jgi:hypothetical protein